VPDVERDVHFTLLLQTYGALTVRHNERLVVCMEVFKNVHTFSEMSSTTSRNCC